MSEHIGNPLRDLPSVDVLLRSPPLLSLPVPPTWRKEAARFVIAEQREVIQASAMISPSVQAMAERAAAVALAWASPTLKGIVNATGVVLHTNFGRAPLSDRAAAAVQRAATGYTNLEFDLDRGERGSRFVHVEALLARIVGADAAVVVNNCAAAVLLALAGLGRGGSAVVSRGELVEIGGSFRMPDVMREAGVRLIEVGTTNRTRLEDYEQAIDAETRMLVKVSRSNFALVGFTEEVDSRALASLGECHGMPVLYDLGSGLLVDLAPHGISSDLTVSQAVASGADVVVFSGDKLLGGPQAGLLVGKTQAIAKLRKHPLLRALRPDKLTIAALQATLSHYVDGTWETELPALSSLVRSPDSLRAIAEQWAAQLRSTLGEKAKFTAVPTIDRPGGGTLPLVELPGWGIAVSPSNCSPQALERSLRQFDHPIVARLQDGAVIFHVRTMRPGDLDLGAAALQSALTRAG